MSGHGHRHGHHGHDHARRFDPANLARLDSPERKERMPPDAIVRAAALGDGARVADVGAGVGYYTRALFESSKPPAAVHAIDVSPEMLAELESRLAAHRDRLHTHVAPAERLPLPDAAVDLVVMGNVFHEFDDATRALGEAHRVLVVGGRILVVDWGVPANRDAPRDVGPPYEHRVAEEDVRAALARAGFVDVRAHEGFRDVYALSARRG